MDTPKFALLNVDLDRLGEAAKGVVELARTFIVGEFEPRWIRKRAQAESDAAYLAAVSDEQIAAVRMRAEHRRISEEVRQQINMERVLAIAVAEVGADTKPADVEPDWLEFFFSRCRLVSDEQMQVVWGRMLAGEVEQPGRFSRRTMDLVATLSKDEAADFQVLAGLMWDFGEITTPFIKETTREYLGPLGLSYIKLTRLEEIGLIHFKTEALGGGFGADCAWNTISPLRYHSLHFSLYLGNPPTSSEEARKPKKLNLGRVLPTRAGGELMLLAGGQGNDEHVRRSLEWLQAQGFRVVGNHAQGTGAVDA